jgi:threonine/homoserine/homoserine lactone efflux protein
MTMSLFATGIALGVLVSLPPGPNSALCVNVACGGVRRAVPLITGAALTDAAYSLLAASGVLFANRASSEMLTLLIPFFMLGAAALAWSPSSLSTRAAIGIAILNPATAALWIGLSSVPGVQTLSVSELLMRPLPVALGTAMWFTLLAFFAAKATVRLRPEQTAWMQRLLAIALAGGGLISLVGLVA